MRRISGMLASGMLIALTLGCAPRPTVAQPAKETVYPIRPAPPPATDEGTDIIDRTRRYEHERAVGE